MSSDLKEFLSIGACVIFGVFALSALLVIGAMRGIARPVDESNCHAFATASGFETKFVDYNFMAWDCLAKTNSGKWVSANNLHEVNQ